MSKETQSNSPSSQMPRSFSPPRTPARFHEPKYNKLLSSPLYTKNVDLRRASDWLTEYLTRDCPTDFMPVIRFDLMGHMQDHDMPDGVVAQSRLLDMNLIPVREVEKLMSKFWERLLKEQHRTRENERNRSADNAKEQTKEKHSSRSKGSSPPKEPARQDWPSHQEAWGWASASSASSNSRSLASAPGSDSRRSRTDSSKIRVSRLQEREPNVDRLPRVSTRTDPSRIHTSRASYSSHSFIEQYSPGPCQSSGSRESSQNAGYSPSFFAKV